MIRLKTPRKILIDGVEYEVSNDSTGTCRKCELLLICGNRRNKTFCYKFRMKDDQYFKRI